MTAAQPRSETTLAPRLAGRNYPAEVGNLTELLARSLVLARSSSIENAKVIVAPLTLNDPAGPVAASAFANLSNRRSLIRKVVILGPARGSTLRGIALPSHGAFATPLGAIPLDAVNLAKLGTLPQVTIDDRGFETDNAVEPLLPFLQACLDRFVLTPIIVGNVYPQLVSDLLQQVWGGPETLIVIASDLSHHLPEDRARAFDIETRGLIEALCHDQITTDRADGHRIIAGALMRAEALDLRVTGLDIRTASVPGGRALGHGAFAMQPAQTARLAEAERRYLLRTAAQSVLAAVENPAAPIRPLATARLPMPMSAIRATTVTLARDGAVRGSMGGLRPYRTLLGDVVARASEAAVGDIRFAPVQLDELRDLIVSISINSTPRNVPGRDDDAALHAIMPGRDGLIIEHRGRATRAMPDVWNTIPDPVLFLKALKQRAGVDDGAWPATMALKRFTAETFSAPLATLID